MPKIPTSNLPKELKPLLPYLQRANELENKSPLVSFYCRAYAAQIGITIIQSNNKSEEATTFLLSLMDKLENEKNVLQPNNEEGRAVVELYALKMFKKADDADRAGRHDDVVAKLFYASSILMEVTKQFGELSEDIVEKQKYARWKAAEISRAIKSGAPVESGPFNSHPNATSNQQNFEGMSTQDVASDFHKKKSNDLHNIDRQDSLSQTTFKNNNIQNELNSQDFHNFSSAFPPKESSSQTTKGKLNQNDEENKISSKSNTWNNENSENSAKKFQNNSSNNMLNNKHIGGSGGIGGNDDDDDDDDDDDTEKLEVPLEKIIQAQKHAKYAMSALQFNDVNTARQNLKTALKLLE